MHVTEHTFGEYKVTVDTLDRTVYVSPATSDCPLCTYNPNDPSCPTWEGFCDVVEEQLGIDIRFIAP